MRNLVTLSLQAWFVLCVVFHLVVWTQLFSNAWMFGLITVIGLLTVMGNYLALWQSGELRTVQSFGRLLARMGQWRFPYLGLCAYVIFRFGQLLMAGPLKGHASTPESDAAAAIFITSSIVTIAASSLGLLRSPSRA